jgi:hypothetical protein
VSVSPRPAVMSGHASAAPEEPVLGTSQPVHLEAGLAQTSREYSSSGAERACCLLGSRSGLVQGPGAKKKNPGLDESGSGFA